MMNQIETRTPTPAVEGWFASEPEPALLGARCTACSTVVFPPPNEASSCPNPRCVGDEFESHRLATSGTVWSYTDAQYRPPPPYIPKSDPYEPFALAAVELAGDGLVVLGQVADGYGVADLGIGMRVTLVIETLYSDHQHDYLIWRWRPEGDQNEQR
jgi:uncharacterized OB-fold protein